MATVDQIQREIAALRARIQQAQTNIPIAESQGNFSYANSQRNAIEISQQKIADLEVQLQQAQQEASLGTASAGQVVAQEQQARAEGSTTQNPPTPTVNEDGFQQSSTGLLVAAEDEIEVGTDGRVRPLSETQATPATPQQPDLIGESYAVPGVVSSQAGVGSPSEDSGQATRNSTRAEIDAIYNTGKITPQPNVLDQYASYTYQASLYLMKPEEYKAMVQSKKKVLPGGQLLIQSGGAPVAGRNTYFRNDYYIDKITLRSAITGKGTNAAHNVNQIKMTIIEPNGITLITNLDKAVQAYLGSAKEKKTNFTAPIYLLVIRFYGYDDAGNLVRGGVARPDGSTTGSAFVEKFYPIAISRIDFKVANKAVEYEIEATAVGYQIATGSSRGTIPYNVEVGGLTVKDALTGPTTITASRPAGEGRVTTNQAAAAAQQPDLVGESYAVQGTLPTPAVAPGAPPNAGTAPNTKLTVKQGLMTALNQYQQELVNRGIYTVPDTFSVEFVNASLEQAKIQVKNPDKNRGGMAKPVTAADQKDPNKQSYDPTSRIFSITAGTQIVQVIDQILRNSTYLGDQALVSISEQGGKQTPNGTPGKNVAGYKITVQAIPKSYDTKRNDYAYDIKYILHIYKLNDLISNYFQVPKYNGVHKQYNYWFTGENTAVLSYEQSYNALYSAVLSGGPGQLGGTVVQDAIKANFQPTSGETSQGAAGRVNEIGANFADYLYNPGDLANATLQIVGDPAWLQQGEAFAAPDKFNFDFNPFLPDGTINFESQQIMFEILINTPADYDLDTGLIDPNVRDTVFDSNKRPGATKQSYVYRANECISEFNKGRFTQTLKGTLLTYLPDQTFKDRQDSGRPTTAQALSGPNNQVRNNPNATANADTVWTEVGGLNVLSEDLPTNETVDEEPILLNSPQPQPAPEPPSSDGPIDPLEGFVVDQDTAGVNSQSQLMDREA